MSVRTTTLSLQPLKPDWSLDDRAIAIVVANQVLGEILHHHVIEIRLHATIAVGLPGHDHEIEPLVRLDERIHQPDRVAGVHVVIYVAGGEQQAPFRFPARSMFVGT